ncbi:hypothetical protein [Kitasatospora sp. NPDC090308]|uniref:hypothetical protein n=1 Tax=Kitasatospora sp. NPDC090308 TaxID=3364082 RepID=UPI00380A9D6D
MGEPAADRRQPSSSPQPSPQSSQQQSSRQQSREPSQQPEDRVCEVSADPGQALRGLRPGGAGERAACVLCGEPTEYPADASGSPLCPVCTWQQAQRAACSG